MADSIKERYTVGYALAAKKQHSFIQPSLIEHSRRRGIDLIKLDPAKPLSEQGRLDCVIHKLYDAVWKENLVAFRDKFPFVPVVDSPEAIERLHNRVSMLEVITQLTFSVSDGERFGVPKQVVVMDESVLSGGGAALGEELKFPVIAKPLDADGSARSHKMFLIYDQEGMKILKAPIVLQEFVNHGGVIFKVYVVGDYVKCVKRRSLPDISEEKIGTARGSLPFSQISNLTANCAQEEKNREEYGEDRSLEKVEMPPTSFLEELAKAMRESMGLNLFNFDVIRDARDASRYLVIDINYFPGYAKMPSYEPVLTEFFWDMVTKKKSHV
ncbi:Inositol-tetrakisphosphate 1-kinase 1 [Raphanus sativus]|uniref:Inositol-tetrakisphosphate 1-kinase n=1 Tax=Raphanus sativus TaxID=3726 RepID=A0A6J0K5V2_RAPSA|nr:inositol-tetrakisphosphate 1-kinase 1 [Raphanus sativus]KAJ4882659.1 Inositol-tetrakisphosphate 1-kinase 1 [Raphanus sativus]